MDPARPLKPDARQRIATPTQFLKGCGPQRAELLERLGLRTAGDVLFQFPRDYEDLSALRTIAELEEGQPASVVGVVEEVELRDLGSGRNVVGVLIGEQGRWLRVVFWNQPFQQQRYRRGDRVLVSGEPKYAGGRWEMHHPIVEHLAEGQAPPAGRILPIYPLTEGLPQHTMRRIAEHVVDDLADAIDDVFPDDFRAAHRLAPIGVALRQIHLPSDHAALEEARRRLIYQELLVLQLALALRRREWEQTAHATPLPATAQIDARIRRLFPFEFTADQEQAIAEVAADLARERPMNRLLQGDVGSGKTIVALYAMLTAVAHGRQAALMAPTEILARQHEATLGQALVQGRVRIGLLAGSITAKERDRLREQAAAGELDVVIGTQAIIAGELELPRLGLVVIDEGHRFGVAQRARLRRAGLDPHYLVMTATPIPRTITLALFGDLDVSVIRHGPPGRQPVHTYLGRSDQRARWWEFVRRKLRDGRQAYVIAPRVEESDDGEAAGAVQLHAALAAGELADFRLGLLHGRQSPAEKAATMDAFRSHDLDVLVATSVVEVGVDVPNATLLTIEGAERFGLAQLHQLRGRVSRGAHPGFVCAFPTPGAGELSQRLAAFASTTDGFQLAELDFQQRGPGDIFGLRQHGLPPLRIADLNRDAPMLDEARHDALALVARSDFDADPAFARLRQMALRRYGKAFELGDVG